MQCTFSNRRTPYIADPFKSELEADRVVYVAQELYPAFDPEESGFGTLEQRLKSIEAQEKLHAALVRYDTFGAKRMLRVFYRFRRARDLFPAVFQMMRMGKGMKPLLREVMFGIGLSESVAVSIVGMPQRALETGIMCANSFLVKLAVEAGADVNRPNEYGIVPLQNAKRVGEEDDLADCAEVLVKAGALDLYQKCI